MFDSTENCHEHIKYAVDTLHVDGFKLNGSISVICRGKECYWLVINATKMRSRESIVETLAQHHKIDEIHTILSVRRLLWRLDVADEACSNWLWIYRFVRTWMPFFILAKEALSKLNAASLCGCTTLHKTAINGGPDSEHVDGSNHCHPKPNQPVESAAQAQGKDKGVDVDGSNLQLCGATARMWKHPS